ncbi:hypothetical protein MD484_g6092, partial [Candolleomyces efflorescens]
MNTKDHSVDTPDPVEDHADDPPRTPTCMSRTAASTTAAAAAEGAKYSAQQLKKSVQTVMGNDAPLTPRSQDIKMTRPDPLVKERRAMLKKELHPFIQLQAKPGLDYASALYPNIANAGRIKGFLEGTDVYDGKRWALPRTNEDLREFMMYPFLLRIINEILRHFLHTRDREAVDTHAIQFFHKEPVDTDTFTSPDICVKGEGSSFQLPDGGGVSSVGYPNVVAFFEVKITTQEKKPVQELLQLAVYARQLFIHQPNRRFVRSLLITEQNFQLFHFDRSGVQYTQEIDIHQHAGVFVRLVLGLCSLNESDVGLDDSLEWKIVNGRKVSGTLKTQGENDAEIIYELAEIDPTDLFYDICGRGLTSWRVVDPASGEHLLVRDMWRSQSRRSEDYYLEKARGKLGLVQMISFEHNRGETAQFRRYNNSLDPLFQSRNRIAARFVLDTHGKSIESFKSPREFVLALRDTVVGHKELYKKRALHRHITPNNIMLGRAGAAAGNRGILIGFDLAKKPGSDASAERHSTAEIHRSIAVLKSSQVRHPLPHSHLDDLESFVYVITYIMFNYDYTGAARKPFDLTQQWSLMSNRAEASDKEAYLLREFIEKESDVHTTWPPSCIKLLLDYKSWLCELNRQKNCFTNIKPDVRKSAWDKLMEQIWDHYQTVLGFFDEAIEKMDSGNDVISPPTPNSVATQSAGVDPASADEVSSPLGSVHEVSDSSLFSSPRNDVIEAERNAARFLSLMSLKRPREDGSDDLPKAKRDHRLPSVPSSPCPNTGSPKFPSPRKLHPAFKRMLTASRQAAESSRAKGKSLEKIPEEDELSPDDGVQYSPPLNIHEHPESFIRLVLALSTTNERALGLDDSIQWTTTPNGTKRAGSLKTVGRDDTVVAYDLVVGEGPITRSGLLGRGTTCWVVKNDRGEKFIVKDYWVSENRPSFECELLEEARGLQGVCQMVSFENNRAKTLDFRGDPSIFENGIFHNRTSVRIVMKAYGRSLENFTSMKQVLGALRDAIAAHRKLLSRNLIHRDISPNNILLGDEDADEGARGILIDLDAALKISGLASETRVDPNVGTRMFQTMMVLRCYEALDQYVPMYDYLDDLEAFFWVFAYIIMAYKPNGDRMPSNYLQERTLGAWTRHFPDAVYASKHGFISSPFMAKEIRDVVDPGWHVIYDDLFLAFRTYMWEEVSAVKAMLLFTGTTTLADGSLAPNRFAPVLEKVEHHYARIIGLFDAALKKIEEDTTTNPTEKILEEAASPPALPSPSASLSTNSVDAGSDSPSITASATSLAQTSVSENDCPSSQDGKSVSSTSPPTTRIPLASPTSNSTSSARPKRRFEEAELDDELPEETKRRSTRSRILTPCSNAIDALNFSNHGIKKAENVSVVLLSPLHQGPGKSLAKAWFEKKVTTSLLLITYCSEETLETPDQTEYLLPPE